jgi:dipeptidyl aminopeptidase/acylaminoacyl peptidase
MRAITRSAILLTAGATLVGAQRGARTPSIDSLLTLQSVGSPRISPNGQRVAYLVTSTDWKGDRFVAQLWLDSINGGAARQLTRHAEGVSQPQWSPDGQWLTYTSSREENRAQVYALPVTGGEPVQLTRAEAGIGAYAISPDGRTLAYTAPRTSAARKERDAQYGGFEVVRRDYAMQAIFTVDMAAAMSTPQPGRQRTASVEWSVGSFDWAPDNAQIAFSAQPTPDPVTATSSDIYVLRLGSDSIRRIVDQAGNDDNPRWSPDGSQLLFTISPNYFRNTRLAMVPSSGGTPRILTESFDEQPGFVAWRANGIYFSASQRTAVHLFRLDPSTSAITRVSAPDSLLGGAFSLDAAGRTAAFIQGSPEQLVEIAVSPLESFSARRITELSAQVRDWQLGTRELMRWRSKDGAEIEGVLIKPRDFDPTRKYPLLCVIHGGPTGVDRPQLPDARYYPVDLWVNRGALVLKVNYRGSAGYGERFRSLNYRNLGVGDAWDVLSGVDALIARGWVDPARVASMGWSQGGYISAFLTTSSTRFRAISVGAGISDWRTYYYNTDITPFTINYLGDDPVDDPRIYARTSPVDYAKGARTPTLIQHGENDRRVPIANAYQLRQVLEDRGVPVEMVVYRGFGHGITKPKAMRAVMEHNLRWFNHHLFGDAAPDLTAIAPSGVVAPSPR